MTASLVFLFVPAMILPGYQSILESKGINDPTLAISLCKTTIMLDAALKLLLVYFVDDIEAFSLIGLFVLIVFFFWFFVRLSLSIPKKSLRKFRKFPQETNYTLCAFQVIGWGVFSFVLNMFLLLFCWSFDDPTEIIIMCGVLIPFMIIYLAFTAISLIRLDRIKYPSTRSLTALSRNNSPIILLRSFKIDSNPRVNGKVFDETICENLDLYTNPIVSLANPDEILPSGGSLKIQAKDSEWKEVVKEILKNCRSVILVEGLSDGLHWEISKLKEYLDNKQLFVLIPSKAYRELAWCYNDDAGTGLYSIFRNWYHWISKATFPGGKDRKKVLGEVWTNFSSKLQEFGIHTPETFPGSNCLLSFDENWNAVKQSGIHDMSQMLNYIVSHTNNFNNTNFDYPKLGEKIASFEVNGFLSKEEIVPFKSLVDKFNKVGRIAALVCFALFLATIILL